MLSAKSKAHLKLISELHYLFFTRRIKIRKYLRNIELFRLNLMLEIKLSLNAHENKQQ